MSAAKRHVSSLLSGSSSSADQVGGREKAHPLPPAKRPRIQELLQGNALETQTNGAAHDGDNITNDRIADDQSSNLSTSSSDTSSFPSSSDEEETDKQSPSTSTLRSRPTPASSSLRDKLNAFLPELHAANESLDPQTASAFEIIDKEHEETGKPTSSANESKQLGPTDEEAEQDDNAAGPYIEMNLGLGVLEQRRSSDAWTSSSSSESSEHDADHVGDEDTHLLGRLMGTRGKANETRKASGDKEKGFGIQEL